MSATLRWVGRAVLAVLAVVGVPQIAHADFINLISQSYRIQGSGTGISAYDQTSAVPIARTDRGAHYDPVTGSQDGAVFISTSANGGVATQSAFVQASIDAFDLGNAYFGFAATDAAITFRPLVSGVVVNTNSGTPLFPEGSAQLYDETIGAAVFSQSGIQPPMTYIFMLDLSHLYTLSVSQSLVGANADFGIRANIAPVPELERTLTFLFVGLGALGVLARSRTFRPSN